MIDQLPCLTVFMTCWACWRSPANFHYQARPSEPKRLILVSSDQMTRFQSSIVQSMWFLVNSRRVLVIAAESFGFSFFSAALKPASWRAQRMVFTLTSIFTSALSLLATCMAVSNFPEVRTDTEPLVFRRQLLGGSPFDPLRSRKYFFLEHLD